MTADPPTAGVEIYLDPQLARERKAQRDRRHNVLVIPALRLLGFLIIATVLLIHNEVVLGAVDWGRYGTFVVVSALYAAISWALLALFYRPFARIDLGFVFLIADNVLWAYAVYVSGGEQSWLFLILLAHVVDQGATTVRRVLLFANVAVLSYLGVLVWTDFIDAQPVSWGAGVAKASLLYAFGLYGALTTAPAEALRRRSVSAIRVARASIADLAAQQRQLEEKQAQLAEAKQRAEKASQAKTEFLARVSHEMRTPMNAILGFGQLLQSDELTPQQHANLRPILDAGAHLLALIDNVLELEDTEQHRVTLQLSAVSIADVVGEVVQLSSSLLSAQDVSLDVGRVDCTVLADRRRLRQVLVNLISNAVKYNRAGGGVTVRCERVGKRVRISVEDTGIGIDADRAAVLFTPFERLGAETSAVPGTGLGLVVSRSLVQAMNGVMGFRSEAGVGSTFWIELPAAETMPPAASEVTVATSPVRENSADALPSRKTPRVLCAEDNPSNARLVEILLARQRGMQVTFAQTGKRALELASDDPPDLVLLDLNLPELSGLEVLRALRANERTRAMRIVVVSADVIPEHVAELLAAGADDYITKPYNISDFLAVVDRLLSDHTA